jgi:YfiH family protein
LGFTEFDSRARVENNRSRFFKALGAARFRLATLRQVHSAEIYQVLEAASGGLEYRPASLAIPGESDSSLARGDALLTDHPGILLSVRSADCLPVLLIDPRLCAVAAVHAGWRGALERIVEKTVGEMRRTFGTRPRDLLAALGPSIRACCYGVGEEVWEKFCSRFVRAEQFFQTIGQEVRTSAQPYPRSFLSSLPPGHSLDGKKKLHLDLVAVARAQLEAAGVPRSKIEVAEFCTACRTDLFFSHRKEAGCTGRTMAVIGIRPRK